MKYADSSRAPRSRAPFRSPSTSALLATIVLALCACRTTGEDARCEDCAALPAVPAGDQSADRSEPSIANPESPSAAESAGDVRWRELDTRALPYSIAWRPEPDPLPLNESFELVVRLRDANDAPLTGAQVVVHGFMPGHGHGMLREPRSEEIGDGLYRVRGMLLHMTGLWEMRIDVVVAGVAGSSSFELELE